MKRLLRLMVCGFSIFLIATYTAAQTISDRENADLKGFVKSVKEETAEVIFRSGKPIERKRQLQSIKTFDVTGKYLTEYNYSNNGKVLYGDTYHYDSKERLIEKTTEHSEFVNLCDKYTYSYDLQERVNEEICYVKNKGPMGKYVYRYDAQGRLEERERIPIVNDRLYFSEDTLERYQYDENGKIKKQTSLIKIDGVWKPRKDSIDEFEERTYSNKESKMSTSLKYDASGNLKYIETTIYDDRENELETISYFPDGSVKDGNRYEYVFDKYGNAIKETDARWVTMDGRSFFQLSEVTYRTLEYFPTKEITAYKENLSKRPTNPTVENVQNKITDSDEYNIYDVLVRKWLESSDLDWVVIDRFTSYRDFLNEDRLLTVRGVEKDVSDDFVSKNKRRQFELIKELFPDNRKIILINASETNETFSDHEKGWKYFYEKYPKSQGLTTISRVGFNREKTRALVYIGTQSDWLAGAGYFVILQKDTNGWKIISEQMIWIS